MLWLAVHLPLLPLEALGPWPEPPLPTLVTEQHRVLVCNAPAHALGVRSGQRAATAAALAPQAIALARDPGREAALLDAVALALACFTPQVSLAVPLVLLEVQASLRLFGGIARLRRQVRGVLRAAGVSVARIGCAPTPLAATLLARQGAALRSRVQPRRVVLQAERLPAVLGRLPLALFAQVLAGLPAAQAAGAAAPARPRTRSAAAPTRSAAPPPARSPTRARAAPAHDDLELLTSLGARTLADLRGLPRAGLARRVDGLWLDALDRAEGRRPDPRRWIAPPPDYRAALELPHRADHADALLAASERLLAGLAGWLALQWRAAQAFELVLRHERLRRGAPDAVLVIELAQPSREAAHLLLVLRERLQRHALAAPVYAVALHLLRSVPHAGHDGSLLADHRAASQDVAGLVDRLRARLGTDAVLRWVPQPDPRPEAASLAVRPEDPRALAAPMPASTPSPPALPRPSWLLREPLPLAERDGRPLHGGALALVTRAERIEHGWFDGRLVRRDYHVALGDDGLLRWVFVERGGAAGAGTAAGEAAPRWFLHGLFG